MNRLCEVCLIASCLLASVTCGAAPPEWHDVRAAGAMGDGSTKDTAAIQRAIDHCAARGGGVVYFPPGVYLSGSLHLRSHVEVRIESGATIRGSRDNTDYDPYETLPFKNDADHETSFFHYALIWGEDIEHVSITGRGVIDGNREQRGGPKPIALKRCRDVLIRDVTIVNAPNYCISMLGTDFVNIDGVRIRNAYCDGIDPDSCQNVRIANCDIESWDDAIVPKTSFSLGRRRATENLTVTNCLLATAANAFKLGTESGGDFKRIAVSNCVVYQYPKGHLATSGISIESVDGSNIDGVVVSNITMTGVETPIFIRLGNRGRDMAEPMPGTLRNVSIHNVVATGAILASSITGIPGRRAEDITLSDVRVVHAGMGADAPMSLEVPEHEAKYPSADMFGHLPAYGLYARHVDGLTLRNVQIGLTGVDPRPGVIVDRVSGLYVDTMTTDAANRSSIAIRLHNVEESVLELPVASRKMAIPVHVSGASSRSIRLLDTMRRPRINAEVPRGAVTTK